MGNPPLAKLGADPIDAIFLINPLGIVNVSKIRVNNGSPRERDWPLLLAWLS